MDGLKDKVAVITGGATGIGKALALALAAEGMKVVIASTSRERLDLAAAEIATAGGEVRALLCDVTDREAVRRLAADAQAAFGPVDLLCANAGTTTAGSYLDHDDADWDWMIDLVLRGVTHCVQAFYPAMAARGSGHILITGSQTAYAPDWVLNHGPYVAAKAAVHALAVALRPEAAEHGVGVSLLVPAATRTDVREGARSRPERYGPSGSRGTMAMRADAPKPLAGYPGYLDAEEVAARAIAGIKANDPIIVTHAGMKPLTDEYLGRIQAAYDAAVRFQTES
ncbi:MULTISPECIES: SDR family NAD(P)-dependent oxidoreductase [unclassified Sphingobium]|uniref:SDR family NAD(P)-dependent oxidoreductase n=1 Tax=unclassified Sphingobium TaxID=2611147 RepID=UPI000D16EA45|nr:MULTISPECIES: SDR family NAD(P)-dependent oxidoreductase [unclassified Sphingobium]MBG6120054.1 3-oxoacyl-[acyl-carrier protein] reductase [Sphingobium sp. JAI105]PSO12892.1 hypothetical protein C7E20_03845 [Sphingobium sp. AEW4]TWD05745.1 short-subunit dehydrogenase [Sphingobium sp. AEW010]TWD23298.1 short-subunit dehydrogenase [Sphingobium sp. AEW013]TWD25158.1 short-subunit dehydrogenase [Sphingobium sp. AEW001]